MTGKLNRRNLTGKSSDLGFVLQSTELKKKTLYKLTPEFQGHWSPVFTLGWIVLLRVAVTLYLYMYIMTFTVVSMLWWSIKFNKQSVHCFLYLFEWLKSYGSFSYHYITWNNSGDCVWFEKKLFLRNTIIWITYFLYLLSECWYIVLVII